MKRTDIVCVELEDTDCSCDGGPTKTPSRYRCKLGELALVHVIQQDLVKLSSKATTHQSIPFIAPKQKSYTHPEMRVHNQAEAEDTVQDGVRAPAGGERSDSHRHQRC